MSHAPTRSSLSLPSLESCDTRLAVPKQPARNPSTTSPISDSPPPPALSTPEESEARPPSLLVSSHSTLPVAISSASASSLRTAAVWTPSAFVPPSTATIPVAVSTLSIPLLSAGQIFALDFAGPAPPPVQRAKNKHCSRTRSAPRAGRRHSAAPTHQQSLPRPTLVALRNEAATALRALPSKSIPIPHTSLVIVHLQPNDRTLIDLVDRGKAHLSYGIVWLLRDYLPPKMCSRGSLTLIRDEIISSRGLSVLAEKLQRPLGVGTESIISTFHGAIGVIADSSPLEARAYVENALGEVFRVVARTGEGLKSLHRTKGTAFDQTREVLLSIRDDKPPEKPIFTLKRRYSPGNENVVPFLRVPSEGVPKRRKSWSAGQREEGAEVAELEHSGPVQDYYLQRAVLKIESPICASPALPSAAWTLILGPASVRDPLETCGDALMCIALTEILIERLKNDKDGLVIRKAVLPILLSNLTFLHLLLSKGYISLDDASDPPKYPGNALEVFAAIIVLFGSIEGLKAWVAEAFEPFIVAAIGTWRLRKWLRRHSFHLPTGSNPLKVVRPAGSLESEDTVQQGQPAKRAKAQNIEAEELAPGVQMGDPLAPRLLPNRAPSLMQAKISKATPENVAATPRPPLCAVDTSYTFAVSDSAWIKAVDAAIMKTATRKPLPGSARFSFHPLAWIAQKD
ncbi:hypothetical protein B0H16DRAFT_1888914 [Mycena metata]|uniref:Uncharacterized protein n=1 Tax=Mycena metata TaxID=1033252 RepID=A0AAD7N5Q6_9AGAR|nr:hypothetical protein B0H16DRAFT_1888914 [Mycena metata]